MMPLKTTIKSLMRSRFGRKLANTCEEKGDGAQDKTTMHMGACSNATMKAARRQSGRTLGPSSDPLQCHHPREVPGMLHLDALQHDFVWNIVKSAIQVFRNLPQLNEIPFRAPKGCKFDRIQISKRSHHATFQVLWSSLEAQKANTR